MTFNTFNIDVGPFAKAKKNADTFGYNLFLSHALGECVMNLIKIQKEYEQALADFDDDLAKRKLLELQTYKSSIVLTAHMFEEQDEIST